MKVLIIYATTYGSTQSIAERIAERISSSNICTTTLQSIATPTDITSFDAAIIGSCIHTGKWISPATNFVSKNASSIKSKQIPVWAFSVGLPSAAPEKMREEMWKEGEPIRKRLEAEVGGNLKGHTLLDGVYSPEKVNFFFRFMLQCAGTKAGDYRNWDAMDGYADQIVKELKNLPGKQV